VEVGLRFHDGIITLAVHDQGCGIPADEQARLFEGFFRGSNVGNTPGTGLGLAIMRRCIELLGGVITVHSIVEFTPLFPPSGPAQTLLQWLPAKSKFLAAMLLARPVIFISAVSKELRGTRNPRSTATQCKSGVPPVSGPPHRQDAGGTLQTVESTRTLHGSDG
jgi:hypothetical protein